MNGAVFHEKRGSRSLSESPQTISLLSLTLSRWATLVSVCPEEPSFGRRSRAGRPPLQSGIAGGATPEVGPGLSQGRTPPGARAEGLGEKRGGSGSTAQELPPPQALPPRQEPDTTEPSATASSGGTGNGSPAVPPRARPRASPVHHCSRASPLTSRTPAVCTLLPNRPPQAAAV